MHWEAITSLPIEENPGYVRYDAQPWVKTVYFNENNAYDLILQLINLETQDGQIIPKENSINNNSNSNAKNNNNNANDSNEDKYNGPANGCDVLSQNPAYGAARGHYHVPPAKLQFHQKYVD